MTSASATPLLVPTKLAPPRPHPGAIRRERLLHRLGVAPATRLTLLIAPAGFGKSTLAAQWLLEHTRDASGAPLPYAWLTLDQYDSDPLAFLAYFAAAIERAVPGAVPQALALLRAAEPPTPAIVLQALLVDLNGRQAPLILVLDDYHLVTAEAVHHTVAYLLRHLPDPIRLVLLSRVDPPLSLVRLRAERHVTELRALDLRFTAEEAEALLTALRNGKPDPAYAAELYRQTEGWAIALQLAALVQLDGMAQGALSSVKHQLAEYLTEEVLAVQPADVHDALLAFAVPERFCAALGAALLGVPDDPLRAESLLEQMLSANLLLTPLDDEGGWLRFHPLFRELLVRRLRLLRDPAAIQALQLQAAAWFADARQYPEAIRLYLEADAGEAAGALVERILHRELGRDLALSNVPPTYWLNLLPTPLIDARPGLLLIKARIAAFQMDVAAALASLERVQTLYVPLKQRGAEPPWPSFDGDLAIVQGIVLYYAQRAPADIIALLWQGLRLGGVPSLVASALAFLARAYAAAGRYGEGVRLLSDPTAVAPGVAVHVEPLVRHTALCMVHEHEGRIANLADEAQQFTLTIALTRPKGNWALFAAAFRGRAAYEQARLEAAATDFAEVREQKYRTNAHTYVGCLIGLGQIAVAHGRLTDAELYAHEARAFADEMRGGFVRNEALGFAVRMALIRGDRAAALRVAEQITTETHLGTRAWYAIAPPQLSQAAAWIAVGDAAHLERADEAITQVIAAVEPVRNVRPLIAALLMQARSMHVRGRTAEALLLLERVVIRAASLGLVRTILDCGPELQPLLRQLHQRGIEPAYLQRLIDGYQVAPAADVRAPITPVGPVLPEMLTQREIEILGLLAERWSDKEIAERLVIAPNTVRKHTGAIYAKLGCSSRREAVQIAQSLGLVR